MRQQEELQYWERSRDYIDGNTARELAKQTQRRRQQVHQEYVEWQEEELEQRKRRRQTRAAVMRNRERALQISPGYAVFLTLIMAVMVTVFVCYLQLHASLNQSVQHVALLKEQVLELKNENDATQKQIGNSVNLDTIRQKAMDELGMVYPQEEQIEFFEVDKDDYMNQYENIPER